MPTGEGHPAIAWLDIDQVNLVREIGTRAGLTFIGAGSPDAARPGEPGVAELARFCPLFRASPPAREALDLLAEFGTPRVLFFESFSGRGEGSLGSRLYDAMETVLSFLGEPETVDASYIAPA